MATIDHVNLSSPGADFIEILLSVSTSLILAIVLKFSTMFTLGVWIIREWSLALIPFAGMRTLLSR